MQFHSHSYMRVCVGNNTIQFTYHHYYYISFRFTITITSITIFSLSSSKPNPLLFPFPFLLPWLKVLNTIISRNKAEEKNFDSYLKTNHLSSNLQLPLTLVPHLYLLSTTLHSFHQISHLPPTKQLRLSALTLFFIQHTTMVVTLTVKLCC